VRRPKLVQGFLSQIKRSRFFVSISDNYTKNQLQIQLSHFGSRKL